MKAGSGLSIRHELFCHRYCDKDSPTFLNATLAYASVYHPENTDLGIEDEKYRASKAASQKLMADYRINKRIADILRIVGFNENVADGTVMKIMLDGEDDSVKMRAVREFNAVARRNTSLQISYTPEEQERFDFAKKAFEEASEKADQVAEEEDV